MLVFSLKKYLLLVFHLKILLKKLDAEF